jgi:DNA (cytosine-5)-methyltransferase 1
MLNGLDLFSGGGGLGLALEEWVRTIAYCENDRYAQAVLLSRMASGELSIAPICDDVRTLRTDTFMGLGASAVDIIVGGFPCQDISTGGLGAGLDGSRSKLFFEIVRLIGELRPRFVFLENVPALTVRGLDRVLLVLTSMGYDCRWTIVSAGEMGAVHERERWFLLGHSNGKHGELPESEYSNPDSDSIRQEPKQISWSHSEIKSAWTRDSRAIARTPEGFTKPGVGRAGNGIPHRMDRHRVLGNAVVPAQAREAFMRLMGIVPVAYKYAEPVCTN